MVTEYVIVVAVLLTAVTACAPIAASAATAHTTSPAVDAAAGRVTVPALGVHLPVPAFHAGTDPFATPVSV